MQFKRDRQVDSEILSILRQRFEDCVLYEAPDHVKKCQSLLDTYNKAAEHWFTKCKLSVGQESLIAWHLVIFAWTIPLILSYSILDGDLGAFGDAKAAYMKQKHRMIWERRHGPVGSGMKEQDHE